MDYARKGYFITGTDTGVGKTVVTAGLTGVFRHHGIDAVAIKPVQTGAVIKNGKLIPEDAFFYRLAADLPQPIDQLNLYRFVPALSPHLAAKLCGEKIEPEKVVAFCRQTLLCHQLTFIEGAGGLCVPLSGPNFTVADLARELSLPLIVVARTGLGTINHTVLTVAYAKSLELEVAGIVFNALGQQQLGPAESDNLEIIAQMTGVPILGILPHLSRVNVEGGAVEGLLEAVEESVSWSQLAPWLKPKA
ncbi:ATP-dependent dethiobiotin synthetase BioD [Thermoanaerobacter kivui]|uniref:ATP-dependent dethiobiotin synthetase BioD n=1 Tax=Thermoanaerobacter kivui TaxID=2325 RepID=A0A097AQ10_THEKI|nr:dethiobiotin synthase [Thermoanaerobacter kivui]AIS51919.1 ATP-dependent dethiobiotin synthetase BioD [Thermoanaerobacter kivui]